MMTQSNQKSIRLTDVSETAADWVKKVVGDPESPVVMFGVNWCGYCFSARDVFRQLGVPLRDIDVQSREQIDQHEPTEIRRALLKLTGSHTVPQIFIGGESLGGATELVAAYRSGQLAEMLAPLGIELKDIGR